MIGGSILARGVVAAYRQALQNATKNGVTQETIQNAVHRGSKMMTGEEAQLILGVTEKTSWEDIVKKFETMFEKNAKSFYLQSKIYRAKEFLEPLQRDTGHPL